MADMERVPWGADETIGDIAAAGSTTFTFTNKRRYFKPENLVVSGMTNSGYTVQGLTITDIKVGTRSLLASSQPVSAKMFRPQSVISHLTWPELGINETVKVTVKNEGSAGVSVVQLAIIGMASKE